MSSVSISSPSAPEDDQHVLDTGTVVVKGEHVEPTLKPRMVRQLRKAVERMRSVMAEYPATVPMLEQPVRHLLGIISKMGPPSRGVDARRLAMRKKGEKLRRDRRRHWRRVQGHHQDEP